HDYRVVPARFSPDGKTVLTGSEDQTAQQWEVASGRPFGPRLRHQDTVSAVSYSRDGRVILTGSYDNRARLWEAATGRPLASPLEHPSAVYCAVLVRSGVVSGGEPAPDADSHCSVLRGRPILPQEQA